MDELQGLYFGEDEQELTSFIWGTLDVIEMDPVDIDSWFELYEYVSIVTSWINREPEIYKSNRGISFWKNIDEKMDAFCDWLKWMRP